MAETRTPRRRRTDRDWHIRVRENWYRDLWLLTITGIMLVAIGALQHESNVRRDQFCHLINSTHADKVRRYQSTIIYLRSPAGREHTLLNDYIRRVSLPQTRSEIARENRVLPPICRHQH